MASNYTCRACLSSLTKSINGLPTSRHIPLETLRTTHRPFRSLTASALRLYHASRSVAAAKPATESQSEPVGLPANAPLATRLAVKARKMAPLMTETYAAYGATEVLFKECARPGDYTIPQALEKKGEIPTDEAGVHIGVGSGWWYEALGLSPTFNNWAHITFLHMYMLTVRLRMLPPTHAPVWHQHLINHCFYTAEDRLAVLHKITSNALRQRWLKDFHEQWRGSLMAYDEGLVKGDAELAAAVWRNVFGGDKDVSFMRLAEIVAYMRREIHRLERCEDDVIARGVWEFGKDPGEEGRNVMLQSRLMKEENA